MYHLLVFVKHPYQWNIKPSILSLEIKVNRTCKRKEYDDGCEMVQEQTLKSIHDRENDHDLGGPRILFAWYKNIMQTWVELTHDWRIRKYN